MKGGNIQFLGTDKKQRWRYTIFDGAAIIYVHLTIIDNFQISLGFIFWTAKKIVLLPINPPSFLHRFPHPSSLIVCSLTQCSIQKCCWLSNFFQVSSQVLSISVWLVRANRFIYPAALVANMAFSQTTYQDFGTNTWYLISRISSNTWYLISRISQVS